jgi:hypothetical protein
LKKDMVNTFVGTSISKSKVSELKPFDGVWSSKEFENFFMVHGTIL